MIAKIKAGNGWRFYEGSAIELSNINFGDRHLYDPHLECILAEDIIRSEAGVTNPQTQVLPYTMTLLIIRNGEERFLVATDKYGYILNNDGKTIDRIN